MSTASRKKIDEKNVKILRDLVSLPHNKYCFDCNQRGPTYVNITIGSFVCTKCSGLLRGITPPHRVKSISMATFLQEEIELLKRRGNDYCKRVWCGLYEGKGPSEVRDEEFVRNFMVDKYERKRYYLEPSPSSQVNGFHTQQTSTYLTNKTAEIKPLVNSKIPRTNGTVIERNHRNANNKAPDFVADFGSAYIYDAIDANKDIKFNNNTSQFSFANFDNNTIFNSNVDSTACRVDDWDFLNFNTPQQQATLFPKCNVNNHWNPFLPLTESRSYKTTTKNQRSWVLFNNEETTHLTYAAPPPSNGAIPSFNLAGTPAPSEDRYAALKDLDNALKEQPQIDWNSSSNGSSYGSVTPTSSIYSTPSPHGSMYGSPSQGQFTSMFPQENKISNPFSNGGGVNWNDNGIPTGGAPNPFRTTNNKVNGTLLANSNGSVTTGNGNAWLANPFAVGAPATNGHSNNPFL